MVVLLTTQQDEAVETDGSDGPQGAYTAHKTDGCAGMTQDLVLQEPGMTNKHPSQAEWYHKDCKQTHTMHNACPMLLFPKFGFML